MKYDIHSNNEKNQMDLLIYLYVETRQNIRAGLCQINIDIAIGTKYVFIH